MVAYEAPDIMEVGSIEELTRGGTSGGFLDAGFPEGTPFSDLTFSG